MNSNSKTGGGLAAFVRPVFP